jgi:hypothetical protein
VGGLRPDDALAVATGHDEEALADRRVAVVAGLQYPILDVVTTRFSRAHFGDPLVEILAGAALVWFLRRGLPEALLRDAAALAAAIRVQLGAVVTEERVKLLAGVAYDTFAIGSKYVGREEFQKLVWELVQNSLDMDEAAAVAAASLPVDAA